MDRPHYDPRAEINVVRDVLRELASQGPIDPRMTPPAAIGALVVPVDIIDAGASMIVQVNLPGAESDDISIDINDGALTVTAQTKPDKSLEGTVYLRRERRFSKLTRTINVPQPVQWQNAEATLHNGVLTIKLPKIEPSAPKSVKVHVE